MTYDVTAHLHKLHRFVVKTSPGAPRGNPLLSPLRHCFAVMLSPGGATDQVCRRFLFVESRHKCEYNCQLGLGLVTLILSSVVNPNTDPVGLVTLMKGQRSPTFSTYSIASWG